MASLAEQFLKRTRPQYLLFLSHTESRQPSGWRKRWCLPPSLRPASSTGPVCCVRLVPESREIVLFSPRVGAYSAVNGPVRPQIVLKGPFSANGKCCCRRPIWRAPEGIPGVASRNLFGGPALAQLFPHILLDPRILIAQRTVAGLPTQDRTFLGLICSVPPLSLSIGQFPADGRGTAVQTASDFSTRNTIIFPQGYHSPLFSAKMVVAHRTASFGGKFY